jgi:MFS family permease
MAYNETIDVGHRGEMALAQTSPQSSPPGEPAASPSGAPEPVRAGRNEWLLVVFTALTNLADGITRVALPLLAHHLTRSPALIAAVGVLLMLPWLVAALHIGVLVDRLNRRRLMVAAETVRLASVAALFAAFAAGQASLALIYIVALVLGVAEVTALTSGTSIVPAAVPRARWPQASARITAMEQLWNAFLGAPIGGVLVAAGFLAAFGTTGVIYAAGMIMLSLLAGNFNPGRAGTGPGRADSDQAPRQSIHAEIREGLSFLLHHRLLRTMAGLIGVMAGTWAAWLALLPAYAAAPGPLMLSAAEYGLLLTCLGAGGVIGTIAVQPINKLLGRRWSMFADIIGSFALVAVPALVPTVRASALAVGAAALVAGVGGTMWTVNSRVIIQSLVPDEMLGRFSAASQMIGWGTAPVAAALGGVLAQFVGFHVAFGVFAVISLLIVVPFLRVVTSEALEHAAGAQSPESASPATESQP